MTPQKQPIVLTIAGSDSCGGAGIQADIKTIIALGGHPMTAVTCTTAQTHAGITDVHALPVAHIVAQIEGLFTRYHIAAIKTGALLTEPIIKAITAAIAQYPGPVVVDPVMCSRSGDVLLQPGAIAAYDTLLRRATVMTPNRHEAQMLSGATAPITDGPSGTAAARLLAEKYQTAVVVKNLQGAQGTSIDVLALPSQPQTQSAETPRQTTTHTHGTGCRHSAAMATLLARGQDVPAAMHTAAQHISTQLQQGVCIKTTTGPQIVLQ